MVLNNTRKYSMEVSILPHTHHTLLFSIFFKYCTVLTLYVTVYNYYYYHYRYAHMYMVFMPLYMITFWQVQIVCGRQVHVNWYTCKPVEMCFHVLK